MNHLACSLHIQSMPANCGLSWFDKVSDGRCVAAVHLDGLDIYFDDPAQIEAVQAVLSEAAERLRALKAPTEAAAAIPATEGM